jgi:hypothetical protein
MDRRVGVMVVLGVVALAACHTIMEEMPTAAGPAPGSTATPAPTEEPGPGPNPTTKTPTPRSTPRPTTRPTATPTKKPRATATPSNGCPHGSFPPSCAPVVRFTVKTFYLVCGGTVLHVKNATSGDADCYVQLDSTAKDAENVHTQPKGDPTWTFTGGYRTHIGGNKHMPKVYGDGRKGVFTVQGFVDGVTSNKLTFTFN